LVLFIATNLLAATSQRRYAIKRRLSFANAKDNRSRRIPTPPVPLPARQGIPFATRA